MGNEHAEMTQRGLKRGETCLGLTRAAYAASESQVPGVYELDLNSIGDEYD